MAEPIYMETHKQIENLTRKIDIFFKTSVPCFWMLTIIMRLVNYKYNDHDSDGLKLIYPATYAIFIYAIYRISFQLCIFH